MYLMCNGWSAPKTGNLENCRRDALNILSWKEGKLQWVQ